MLVVIAGFVVVVFIVTGFVVVFVSFAVSLVFNALSFDCMPDILFSFV